MVQSMELGSSDQRKTLKTRVRIQNQILRLGLAETLSTYVMMVFGLCSVAQVVTGKGEFGQYISINLSFGLAVALGVHVGGGVSGAHMNAAVSFSSCVFGTLRWRLLPLYVTAQFIGSFLAAATVYAVYYESIHSYCGGNLTVSGPVATAGIFSTYPAPYLSLSGGFIDQVFGTAMLLLCLSALSDRRNQPCPAGGEPVAVGLLVLLIGMSVGSNSGYAINPTRDIGPRVFTAIAGWGPEVFRAGNWWWWVPLVAPCVGAVVGTGLYKLLVQLHHPLLSAPSAGESEEPHRETEPLEKHSNCVV
ncbi:aquaporin-7 [Periophthalmus magnuspinnatus]|uniref:aquaporin-7 n=1 Tax=Periophthalmus magnuspinnatus TaxID=409849 RepID=UPI00145A8E03|nr:aquaporin-7 [Periophthalmus magnuspinnatus]